MLSTVQVPPPYTHWTNGRAQGQSPERGESGFRAVGGASLRTPGWAPPPIRLPFPSATSFQPCPPVRTASGAAAATPVPAASLFPSFPPHQIPEFARHGFTYCGRPALRGQGEQLKEGARCPRVGLRRLRALKPRGLPPLLISIPARLKGALILAGRQLCMELLGPCALLAFRPLEEKWALCSPPACGLGQVGRTDPTVTPHV